MDIYELIVNVEILSFFNDTQEYALMRDTLSRIDEKTYSFSDARAFFEYHKKYLYRMLARDFENQHGFSPTDINLGESGIYVLKKNDHPKRALFKNIDFKGEQVKLEDIIIYRMMCGNLSTLYQCDKERTRNGDYDSFFEGLPEGLLDKIETECCTNSDVKMLWEWLGKSSRRYPLMRFLLTNPNDYDYFEMRDKFNLMIPSRESRHEEKKTSSRSIEYNYRPPYNDD